MPSGSQPEADERTTWGWGRRGGGQGGCSLVQLATAVPVDLRGGDCEAPRNHQLAKLAADARSMSGPIHTSSLHPDRARWCRPPGPGVPGHQRLLSRPTGSLAPPCDAGHRLALPLCQDLAVIEGW